MADKSTFTGDEWKTLLESVMATGIAVTAAEPSGLWGLLQRVSQAENACERRRWTLVLTHSSKPSLMISQQARGEPCHATA